MRLLHQNTLILFFLAIWGCSLKQNANDEEPKADIPVIDVENAAKSENEVLLSDVSSDITYVPLETTDENLINEIGQIEMTDSFIFISDFKKLYQFNISGRFIRQIGRIGRGPGEYSSIIHYSVNQDGNTILLLGEYKFLKYDFSGSFKADIDSKFGIDFTIYHGNRVAFYRGNNVENPVNITITNQAMKPLYKFENCYPRPKSNLSFVKAPLFVFENNLYFKEHYNDTLYCLKDSVLVPHMVYNERDLLLDRNFDLVSTGSVNDLKEKLKAVQDKWVISDIYENKRFVFTSYYRGLGPMAESDIGILFDKIESATTRPREGKLKNDIDAGIDIWPMGIYQDNLMIFCLMSHRIKAHIASDVFKNSKPNYPEKKKELEKLARSLDENDNPVLMLVELKE